MKPIYGAIVLILVLGFGYFHWMRSQEAIADISEPLGTELADVLLPATMSANAKIGKIGFEAKCAACHGLNAAGRDGIGPPLIHKIYEPNHHGDRAFYVAAANGVRQHHWPFGNMPAVDGVTPADIKAIVAYVRELQVANGIN